MIRQNEQGPRERAPNEIARLYQAQSMLTLFASTAPGIVRRIGRRQRAKPNLYRPQLTQSLWVSIEPVGMTRDRSAGGRRLLAVRLVHAGLVDRRVVGLRLSVRRGHDRRCHQGGSRQNEGERGDQALE
jgi:hypothetical protein